MFELQVIGISKHYAHKTVLKDVSLSFCAGQTHGLLGENGAGKSTLAEIIAGYTVADSGFFLLNNTEISLRSPRNALQSGIAMVEQYPNLSEQLPLWQNCILGTEQKKRLGWVSKKHELDSLNLLAKHWSVELDFNKSVQDAFPYERFFISLFSAMRINPRLLILDEPSAVLNTAQRIAFYRVLKKEVASGLSVLLITHSIEDALQYSDSITVLNKGGLQKTLLTTDKECTKEYIHSLMFNSNKEIDSKKSSHLLVRDAERSVKYKELEQAARCLAFSVHNASALKGLPHNFSFEAYSGEVTVVFGEPNILHLFESLCTGMYGDTSSVNCKIQNTVLKNITPKKLRSRNVALISSNKMYRSSNPSITVYELLVSLQAYTRKEAQLLIERQGVAINLDEKVSHLSGGMLQRLILARELAENPKVLILSEPALGLDRVGELELWKRLQDAALDGCAVIVLTSVVDNASGYIDIFYELKRDILRLVREINKAHTESFSCKDVMDE